MKGRLIRLDYGTEDLGSVDCDDCENTISPEDERYVRVDGMPPDGFLARFCSLCGSKRRVKEAL